MFSHQEVCKIALKQNLDLKRCLLVHNFYSLERKEDMDSRLNDLEYSQIAGNEAYPDEETESKQF